VLFNSFEFIFVFLPFVLIIYFLLNRFNHNAAKLWLLACSLFFYSWWNPKYLPLILSSLVVNYFIGTQLGRGNHIYVRKFYLTVGIIFNVGLLGYFKYYDFFITNVNAVLETHLKLLHLTLPLAISFYTFQQIAYLVDSYKQETKEYTFFNYALFVAFFPQLIAGPIVHHGEMMPQFKDKQNRFWNHKNFSLGIYVFSIGLFKKLMIADTFAVWANKGFDQVETLTFFDAWIASFSYTFQLYFDFSGYSDMAIGAALLFNIRLPINFNSPYKALTIQDFWRRWHITLSSFLTRYVYFPLGGSRKGRVRTYINILIIFIVSGIWHGAGFTFILWGFLHGLASVIYRAWTKIGFRLPKLLAWVITFNFVNITWVFFRARSFEDAIKVFKGMFGLNGFTVPEVLVSNFELYGLEKLVPSQVNLDFLVNYGFDFSTSMLGDSSLKAFSFVIVGFMISLLAKNSIELRDQFKPNVLNALFIAALFVLSVYNLQRVSEFLYFNF
jgi:alginate O-acetyltransferase complex protein AlgI